MQQAEQPRASRWYGVPPDASLPLAVAVGLCALFIATLPVDHLVYLFPATLEFSQGLLIAGSLLVAAFGFADFGITRRAVAAIIGAAFLFYAIDAVMSLVLLPSFLPPDQRWRLASSPPWLYTLRHAAFAVFAIWYGREARRRDGVTHPFFTRIGGRAIVLLTTCAALASTLAIIAAIPVLPSLVGPLARANFVNGPFAVTAVILIVALISVLRIPRRTQLDQWLAVALWALFIDVVGHTIDTDRFTVAFYVYRFAELVGVFAVLGFLVYYGFETYRTASVEAGAIGERRREQQRRFAATVNSAAIGIAHLDEDGRILFANDQLARTVDRPIESLARQNIWELFGSHDRAFAFDGVVAGANERMVYVTVTITPSQPADDGSEYWIAIVSDVTARKEAERAVLQMNEMKSQFIATVTHEIRTPLSGIVGVSELLRRTTLTEKQRRFTETMDSSAHALLRLVNDVLDFSKIDAANVEFERTLFDLVHLVEVVAEGFSADATRRGLRLRADVAPELVGGFYGDPVRLRQILDNLVNNAVKFTERGDVTLSVERAVEGGRQTLVTFRVTDTGIGIASSEQERIFEVFAQAKSITSRLFGGSGLGLAIVRKLVELMGGEIAVTSEEGHGATFSFTVPLEPEVEGRRLDNGATSLRGLRCIVISPDHGVSDVVLSAMISWGTLVSGFTTQQDALEELQHDVAEGRAVNCAVVDGELEGVAAFVGTLEADHRFEDLSYIFLGSPPHDAVEQISLWRRRTIGKPVRASSLYDAIAQMCVRGGLESGEPRLELPPLRSERILVAEDNETNRMLAMAQLEQLGFGADFVEDGAGAIAAVKTGLYSLVLMDGQMPRVDGFEATRAIRAFERERGTHIPIIAMTASTSAGYRERCLAAGMDDYLAKPVLLSSLEAALKRWVPRVKDAEAGDEGSSPVGFDLTRLRAIFHEDEAAIRKVLDSALRTFDDGIEQLSEAIPARDSSGAAKSAHRMAGVALDIDLEKIATLCRQLENDASQGAWPQIDRAFESIESFVEDFRLAVASRA